MEMNAIINAKILKPDGTFIENGCIFYNTKIIRITECADDIKDAKDVFDAKGAYLIPGLIDAHCHLGMVGDSVGAEGDDGNEDTEPITPHLRAIDAIYPQDRGFKEAYKSGVTCVVTGPGSANPIGGQFAAVKTFGNCVDKMIVKAPCAIKFALGENPKTIYSDKSEAPVTRMGTMALIREALYKAKEYERQLTLYQEDSENNEKPEFDIKNDALVPLIRKEIPAKIHAHRADDICSAIRLSKEFGINITLEHCTDGEIVADIINENNIPVMLGPTLSDRSKPELSSLGFSIYKTLPDMGIDTAIITDHPEITIDNLLLCAQLAVRNGMNPDAALSAITKTAAKNCGISGRVGTIAAGKDADFAIFDKHPLDFTSKCIRTVIDGVTVHK